MASNPSLTYPTPPSHCLPPKLLAQILKLVTPPRDCSRHRNAIKHVCKTWYSIYTKYCSALRKATILDLGGLLAFKTTFRAGRNNECRTQCPWLSRDVIAVPGLNEDKEGGTGAGLANNKGANTEMARRVGRVKREVAEDVALCLGRLRVFV